MLPANLRKLYGLEEGAVIIAEKHPDGILIRSAAVVPMEVHSRERKAEIMLSSATKPEDYYAARQSVRAMGLDPDQIPHPTPPRVPEK